MPIIAAKPKPSILNCPNSKTAPPNPKTIITEDTIIILAFVKSTFASIMFLIPIDEIIPNNKIEIPPITGVGMVAIIAVNFGIN